MSKILKSLFAVLALQAAMPLASAQTTEKARTYGVTLGMDATRTWDGNSPQFNSLTANSSLLFLNDHFHVGPAVSYVRSYTDFFQSTTWGLGVMGKWTAENIQTADRTLFVELSAGLTKTTGGGGEWEDNATATGIGVGYEMFLNSFVSLAPSIQYNKIWLETEEPETDTMFGYEENSAQSGGRLHLGLNIYL